MTYQVLARKWRPRKFSELVGQVHVVKALTHAIKQQRLHHAYLFTGTRGVGKTTLARIFAKTINCLKLEGFEPCGQCEICAAVDQGHFPDLIEVDAASRTKVEQTRELLENTQYAPAMGQYKVYLIDEVHMLSGSSFNAFLKTLEEPPAHVKFLLATTDPQKLPVTVLSRCLQLNLKRLPVEQIAHHLSYITEQEQISAETDALTLLAQAADGSMRDSLSLLDQAIVHGAGAVQMDQVEAMLGLVSRQPVLALVSTLAEQDIGAMMRTLAEIADTAPDFQTLLQQCLQLLHRVALYQQVPDAVDSLFPANRLADLAAVMAPETVQLFYQIGLIGLRDLALSPDPREGLEMVLLRMLAFVPGHNAGNYAAAKTSPKPFTAPEVDANQRPLGKPAPAPRSAEMKESGRASSGAVANVAIEDWGRLIEAMKLGAMTAQLAKNCRLLKLDEQSCELALAPEQKGLHTPLTANKLQTALRDLLGKAVKLEIRTEDEASAAMTPARAEQLAREQRQQQAEQVIAEDPVVQSLSREFSASIVPGSIRPETESD